MATQTIEFRSPPSQTITAKLFAVGSDTQVASVSTTEATNRKGTYAGAYTDVPAGEYELIALVSTTPVARWFVTLTLTTATFQVYDKSQTVLMVADVVNASALAADAVTEIQSGLAIAATALSTTQWTNTLAANIGTTNTTVAIGIDATISSRLASASYTAPSNLTAAQIATGVWQDATAGDFTTASSVGKSLYNAFTAGTSVFTVAALANAPSGGGGGGDPWATVEPGSYIAGTFGYLLSTQIADKTDLIGNASAITSLLAAAVLEPGTITSFPETLTIGDSYTTANGRSIQIPIVDTDGTPISVTGTLYFADAIATFTIKRNGETDTSRTISGTATFTDPPGTGTGDEAPYATIELLPSETIKGLIGYKYSGVLTFTWTGTGSDEDEVMSFETDTILFDN